MEGSVVWLFTSAVGGVLVLLFLWFNKPTPKVHLRKNSPFQVVVIGAGAGGICTGVKLEELGIPYIILEAAPELGGTWYYNKYPGAACDVPSVVYSYSFEKNYEWSRDYSGQEEILRYFQYVAKKYKVFEKIQFQHKLLGAVFDPKEGTWELTVEKTAKETKETVTLKANVIVSAVGQLNNPFIPSYPNSHLFKGPSFHSARWRSDIDLTGKRVAIIGTGPSSVQITPAIAALQDSKVYLFARTQSYFIKIHNKTVTSLWKFILRYLPVINTMKRWSLYLTFEFTFGQALLNRHSNLSKKLKDNFQKQMRADLASKPHLVDRLVPPPSVPPGCKRLLMSNGYLEALMGDKVEMVVDQIEDLEERGIVTKERVIEVDAIVYATGFYSKDFLAGMSFVSPLSKHRTLHGYWGLNAINQADKAQNLYHDIAPKAYWGITVPKFPNFFILYGPNTNLGHNSIIFMLEAQVGYVMDGLRKIVEEGVKYMDLKEEVMDKYQKTLEEDLEKTVFAGDCKSWYKTEDGKIVNNGAYSTCYYWWKTRKVNRDDYFWVK